MMMSSIPGVGVTGFGGFADCRVTTRHFRRPHGPLHLHGIDLLWRHGTHWGATPHGRSHVTRVGALLVAGIKSPSTERNANDGVSQLC